MDWEDWLQQYPKSVQKSARTVVEKSVVTEGSTRFNPSQVPEINWDSWRSQIKTPGAVDWIKAEFDAVDNSNYGVYYTDDLTEEARKEMVATNSAEVKAYGAEAIENGVEKSFTEAADKRLKTSKAASEHATHWLEELYKDREQIEARVRGYITRGAHMDLAEYPEAARELDEFYAGNAYGSGTHPTAMLIDTREYLLDVAQPDRHDQGYLDQAQRSMEQDVEEFEDEMKAMGVDIDMDAYSKQKRTEFLGKLEGIREEYRSTSHTNTGERQLVDHAYTEVPGSG